VNPRPLTRQDLEGIDALRPPDWAPFRETYLRYFARPFCRPVGLDHEGRLVATGTLILWGTSAWMAQVITAPEFRGRGLATRIVDHLITEGRRLGVRTLSLVATDAGWPLYARAGFRVEGEYQFWRRPTPAPAEPEASEGLQPLGEGRWSDAAPLDSLATGEDRGPWLEPLAEDGWVTTGSRGVTGFFLPSAGEGLVVARTVRAGVALLHRRLDGSDRAVVPVENPQAPSVLESRGFVPGLRARRMVLGPGLDRRPEWVWPRIAGSLG